MLMAFGVLFVMTMALVVAAHRRGDDSLSRGFKVGGQMFVAVAPLLVLAFLVAGLIQVAIPPQVIRSWLGEESGLRGILVGTMAGALVPAGPYIAFPVVSAMVKAGASIGTAVALITGWAMLGIGQIPFESALIGPRFMGIRICIVLVTPLIAGVVAQLIFGGGF